MRGKVRELVQDSSQDVRKWSSTVDINCYKEAVRSMMIVPTTLGNNQCL